MVDASKHSGLVRKLAKKHICYGVEFEDLMAAGNEGLMEAVKRYDPEKGKFSTYAVYWIRAKIFRYIQSHRVVNEPPNIQDENIREGRDSAVVIESYVDWQIPQADDGCDIHDSLFCEQLLSHLNERDREIMKLRYYDNLLPGEIAEMVGLTRQGIDFILERGLIKMKKVGSLK